VHHPFSHVTALRGAHIFSRTPDIVKNEMESSQSKDLARDEVAGEPESTVHYGKFLCAVHRWHNCTF